MKKQQQKKQRTQGKKRRQKRKKNTFGYLLIILQAIVSVFLLISLTWLGMLPMKYITLAGLVLLCLWLVCVLTQVNRKKSGILGKVYGIFMIAGLSVGVFYIAKTTNLIGQISGNAFKTEKVVVAVLDSDPAEKLEDAAEYQFGIQFDKGADTMESALATISEELGQDVETIQYDNLKEQAEALYSGEVQAIVYNTAYSNVIESE